MDITEFPSGVIEHLGWYVYRLIDPRDGSTFYVGKGKGNRVFAHMRGEVAAADDDELLSNKLKQIREIRLAGLEVIHVIGNDSNLLIVFYVQIMPDDFVMQLHRF